MRALTASKILLLIAVACILFAGCRGQEAPSAKRARLIAAENKKLLGDLDSRDREIAELKSKHQQELAKQKKLLGECNTERAALKEQVKTQIETNVTGILESVMDQNRLLQDQVQKLQAELDAIRQDPGHTTN